MYTQLCSSDDDTGLSFSPSLSESSASVSTSCSNHTTPSAKNKKKGRENIVEDAILRSLNDISERRESRREVVEVEEDFFARHTCMAAILRRLPQQKRALAKIRVQQMLFEIEFSDSEFGYEALPPSFDNF